MAVTLLYQEISELCIGKPALRTIPASAAVGEALLVIKRCGGACVCVSSPDGGAPLGRICMADVVLFICADENLASPAGALASPVSVLLPGDPEVAAIRLIDPHCSVLEALDVILDDGAQYLVVPIRSSGHRRKLTGETEYCCWLSQEDLVRYFFNSIALLSSIAALSISDLSLVRPPTLIVGYRDPALSALPLLRRALSDLTSVAVVAHETDHLRLLGEISPSTLASGSETLAPALAALSAGDLLAYIDSGPSPPAAAVLEVKSMLREKGLTGMLEFLENELSPPFSSSSSSSSTSSSSGSPSSSSDEEGCGGSGRRVVARRARSMGASYSARMGRRTEEAIVCHPESSLVAVLVRALAHRVGYVWVVDDEYGLVGAVVFSDVLCVFRDQLLRQL